MKKSFLLLLSDLKLRLAFENVYPRENIRSKTTKNTLTLESLWRWFRNKFDAVKVNNFLLSCRREGVVTRDVPGNLKSDSEIRLKLTR